MRLKDTITLCACCQTGRPKHMRGVELSGVWRWRQVEEERNVRINHGIPRATVLYGLNETAHREEALVRRYHPVRQFTDRLCQPLMTEDYVIQAMPDVSPPKWHLAHTSWFFETFILALASQGYQSPHASYAYLFNSYYVAAG